MNIGILTGGGDCPGLNAVIRAVVRKSIINGHKVFGIKRGWKGLLDKDIEELTLAEAAAMIGLLPRPNAYKMSKLSPKNMDLTMIYDSFTITVLLTLEAIGACGPGEGKDFVKDGNIVIRPIMYLALSYDHRIIDGKEAVSFLKTIKECLEEPRRLFLDL